MDSYLAQTKVVMAMRLVEIQNQIEGKRKMGVTKSELEEMLDKLKRLNADFNIKKNELPELLRAADKSGQIVSTVVCGNRGLIQAYNVSPIVAIYYDGMLENLGLIEKKIEIKFSTSNQLKE